MKKWKTLMVNYPRSGSNFLHQMVKKFGFDVGKTHAQDKRFFDEDAHNLQNLIVIVRDYKESIPRHTGDFSFGSKFRYGVSNKKPVSNNPNDHHSDYIGILEFYHNFNNNKILIYYEDLVTNTERELKRVLDFLSENEDFEYQIEEYNKFINDLDKHKNDSRNWYNKNVGGGAKSGENLKYHSSKISVNVKNKIDNYLKSNYPQLFEIYLKKYIE